MAAEVSLSQALSYARDLRRAHEVARAREAELVRANDRLTNAYQQSLQYAVDLKKTYRRLQRAIFQSLLGLANALEAKDPYTRGHSVRVASLARQLALRMGLPHVAAETISQAALLHDLGKIAVPESILRKPGPLTHDEWDIMRRHPLTGAQIVAPLEFFDDGAIIVRHHHERLDGSGYPDGLAGEAIPLGARIVAVADVYDALTSGRPYRSALDRAEAVEALRGEAGHTLDERVAAVLVDALAHAPVDARTTRNGGGSHDAAERAL
jgi:putative nucleotidyltransferase with HDIG domain